MYQHLVASFVSTIVSRLLLVDDVRGMERDLLKVVQQRADMTSAVIARPNQDLKKSGERQGAYSGAATLFRHETIPLFRPTFHDDILV
jgi:hypothetical protein